MIVQNRQCGLTHALPAVHLPDCSQCRADGEWHPAKECLDELMKRGFTQATIKNAKKTLGVESQKSHGSFVWRLKKEDDQDHFFADSDEENPFGF